MVPSISNYSHQNKPLILKLSEKYLKHRRNRFNCNIRRVKILVLEVFLSATLRSGIKCLILSTSQLYFTTLMMNLYTLILRGQNSAFYNTKSVKSKLRQMMLYLKSRRPWTKLRISMLRSHRKKSGILIPFKGKTFK